MEIIGKTSEGFLCNLSSEEIKFIVTGDWYGELNVDKALGKTVKIGEVFEKCRIIEKFKTNKEYNSVREQLESLLKALTKVEKFVDRQKKQIT